MFIVYDVKSAEIGMDIPEAIDAPRIAYAAWGPREPRAKTRSCMTSIGGDSRMGGDKPLPYKGFS